MFSQSSGSNQINPKHAFYILPFAYVVIFALPWPNILQFVSCVYSSLFFLELVNTSTAMMEQIQTVLSLILSVSGLNHIALKNC